MTVSILTALRITLEADAFGQILGGGLLITTQAGSDIPLQTFQDINCTVPNTNPVVFDATGRSIVRYLPQAYKLKLTDKNGSALWTLDNFWPPITTEPGSATAIISGLLNPQTAAEIGAGVTPVNLLYPQGNPRRYGALIDGISDDTTALLQWALVPGSHTFPGASISVISRPITLVSNSKYEFGEGGTITTATQDISMFSASSANNITIRGAKFQQTLAGIAPNIGGISLAACTDCLIEDCEFVGMQFAGIYAQATLRCTFRNNYIHACLGTMQNSADIYVVSSPTAAASYNIIDGNQCFGQNNEFGIAVWDPYSGVLPLHNVVSNNCIANHNGYDILVYMPDEGDSYTQVIGNSVENISAFAGLPVPNTDSGTGIYLSGDGIGGTKVIGNTVRNCCIGTSTESQAPAAIGVNGSGSVAASAASPPSSCEHDLYCRSSTAFLLPHTGGASVIGNTIRHPTATGANPRDAIRISATNNVTVQGNTITLLTTTTNQEGIMLFAQGGANTNIVVSGNTINGGHHAQIRCAQSGGNLNQFITITGNICSGGDNNCIPMLFDTSAAQDVQVTGNSFQAGNAVAVSQAACLNITYENNRLRGTGTIVFTTSGVCTSSYFGLSNLGTGNGAGVSNAATGCTMDVRGAVSAPVAGTWAAGDVSRNITATGTATVFLNVCTVAGTPGTWKTLSNT
jgi:parallel beta-helix repeat protein